MAFLFEPILSFIRHVYFFFFLMSVNHLSFLLHFCVCVHIESGHCHHGDNAPHCTGPMEEGSVLPGKVPQPHCSFSQLIQRHRRFLLLQKQSRQEDPRLQHGVLFLRPHQPVGGAVHKVHRLLSGPRRNVSLKKFLKKDSQTKLTTQTT